jgi:hypothetical protein
MTTRFDILGIGTSSMAQADTFLSRHDMRRAR